MVLYLLNAMTGLVAHLAHRPMFQCVSASACHTYVATRVVLHKHVATDACSPCSLPPLPFCTPEPLSMRAMLLLTGLLPAVLPPLLAFSVPGRAAGIGREASSITRSQPISQDTRPSRSITTTCVCVYVCVCVVCVCVCVWKGGGGVGMCSPEHVQFIACVRVEGGRGGGHLKPWAQMFKLVYTITFAHSLTRTYTANE